VTEGRGAIGHHWMERTAGFCGVYDIGRMEDRDAGRPGHFLQALDSTDDLVESLHQVTAVLAMLLLQVDAENRRLDEIDGQAGLQAALPKNSSSYGKRDSSSVPVSVIRISSSSFTPSRPPFSPI